MGKLLKEQKLLGSVDIEKIAIDLRSRDEMPKILLGMRDFSGLTRRHHEDIFNYSKLAIVNGAVEGLNNKTKIYYFTLSLFRKTAKPSRLDKFLRRTYFHFFL